MSLSNAIYSGLCASFASMFGKLSGLELLALDEKLRHLIKILSFCLMIILNSLVWTFFVKALHKSETTLEATAVSSAVNYIFSGILGYLIFDEVMGLLWWVGITFIVFGIAIISNSNSINKQDFEKRFIFPSLLSLLLCGGAMRSRFGTVYIVSFFDRHMSLPATPREWSVGPGYASFLHPTGRDDFYLPIDRMKLPFIPPKHPTITKTL